MCVGGGYIIGNEHASLLEPMTQNTSRGILLKGVCERGTVLVLFCTLEIISKLFFNILLRF